MGSDQRDEAAEDFRREAAALERDLGDDDAGWQDDEMRRRLDRLGDLFLTMTGRAVPSSAEAGASLSPTADAR